MDPEIRDYARGIYVSRIISLDRLSQLASEKFHRPVHVETLKQWSKEAGWVGQRRASLSVVTSDAKRIQVMKDLVYDMALEAYADDIAKLVAAYDRLLKVVVPPEKGKETQPDDLLKP